MQVKEIVTFHSETGRRESGNFFKISILFERDDNTLLPLDAYQADARSLLDALSKGNSRFEVCYRVTAEKGHGSYTNKYFTNVNLLSYICIPHQGNNVQPPDVHSNVNAGGFNALDNDRHITEDDIPL